MLSFSATVFLGFMLHSSTGFVAPPSASIYLQIDRPNTLQFLYHPQQIYRILEDRYNRRSITRLVSAQDESDFDQDFEEYFEDDEKMIATLDTPEFIQNSIGTDDTFFLYDDEDVDADNDEDGDLNYLSTDSWNDNEEDVDSNMEQLNKQRLRNDSQTNVQIPVRRLRRNKKVPIISILGRPNVGKSALVNRIAGTQSGKSISATETSPCLFIPITKT